MKVRWMLLTALMALWPLSTAFAIDQADDFEIESVTAYGSVIESGDLLVLVQYHIDYGSLPIETAGQAFMLHYYDGSATPPQRASALPYVFVRSGYGHGVMSLYITATNVSNFSITWADADSVQLTGNPSFFASPQNSIEPITWSAQTSPALTIKSDIMDIARGLEIETEWVAAGKTLTTEENLTDDGTKYFVNAIPNLRTMAPGLFAASLGNPDFTERDHGTTYADSLDNFWAGSALENNWDNLADWMNVPSKMIQTMVVLGIAIGAGAWVVKLSGEGMALMPVTGAIIVGGTLVNWVPVQFTAMLGFLGLLAIAFALFLKKAAA